MLTKALSLHENNTPAVVPISNRRKSIGAMSSSPANSGHEDMSPTKVCFHSRWWQKVMFRLYENNSNIMLNQPYTEGVISLLDRHVHPKFFSQHSEAVRGASLVITTFLIRDRNLTQRTRRSQSRKSSWTRKVRRSK